MATDEPTHPSSMVSATLPHCNAHVDRVKSLLSRLKPLEIPQEHQDLTTFTPFPKLPIELRVMIWTLVSTGNPQCIPLYYSKDCTSSFKKVPSDMQGHCQPPIFQVCHESRTVGQRYYSLVRERGPGCRVDCPRCRYEASGYANMWGYTKQSQHIRLPVEERNVHWVNFKVDTFVLSYGTNDGTFKGLSLPTYQDFVFEISDLKRIQRLEYLLAADRFSRKSIHWCFEEDNVLEGLKEVHFDFLVPKRYKIGQLDQILDNELLRTKDQERYFEKFEYAYRSADERLGVTYSWTDWD